MKRILTLLIVLSSISIDAHGDAHAKDGFCTSIRKAEVIGTIQNNKFVVTRFKLLPLTQQ